MELHKQTSFCLWALLFLNFIVGFVLLPARPFLGDPNAWRHEARSIVLNHSLQIDPAIAMEMDVRGRYFVQNEQNNAWYSKYGILNSVVNLLPLALEKVISGDVPEKDNRLRRLLLNLNFLGIGLLVIALMFLIARSYVSSGLVAAVFVLFAVYTTNLWYYLRVPAGESSQVLFFLLFYFSFLRLKSSAYQSKLYLTLAWFGILALCLNKLSFLLLIPVFSAFLLFQPVVIGAKRLSLRGLLAALLPGLMIVALIGTINQIKFGGWLLSGYHQWEPERVGFGNNLFGFFGEIILSERWGLFSTFPLLLLAVPMAARFYRRFTSDAVMIAAVSLCFLITIGLMPSWKGEWAYGPRYFLFFLPVLSLPAVLLLEDVFGKALSSLWRKFAVAVMAAVFLALATFQFQVIRMDPFFAYKTEPHFPCIQNPSLKNYFGSAGFARIQWHALAAGGDLDRLWYMEILKNDCPQDLVEKHKLNLNRWLVRPNFYWFVHYLESAGFEVL